MSNYDAHFVTELARYLEQAGATRRGFIKSTVGTAFSLTALGALAAKAGAARFVIVENAEGLLVVDGTRCVACRRCELACTEYNDGKAQPALARIKVARNVNFGPLGQQAGFGRGMGISGNFRIVPDTCLQCPHPVPCATACLPGAIVVDEKTGARVVDTTVCTGCRLCQRACPWDMMVFDEENEKATKCFLCGGTPECVAACPTGAVRYLPWRDLRRAVPIRQAGVSMPGDVESAGCTSCHTTKG
jgi:Fe-S-cluster-containing dehydrogenase component